MNTRDLTKEEAEVISMEEYLCKEKENKRKRKKTQEKRIRRSRRSLMPLEFYMVSSLAWS